MDKVERKRRLADELDQWCRKGYGSLLEELRDVVAYESGDASNRYQVEVQLLERTPKYVHVSLSLNDGGWRSFVPLSTSFLVYRDGRVERPKIK
jgi:hypothetical protein